MTWTDRLAEAGIKLPDAPTPGGAYVPAVRTGSLVFTSGQVPVVDGKIAGTGKVTREVTLEEAQDLAVACVLNALACVHQLAGIDSVVRIVKQVVFVAAPEGFTTPQLVANAASETLLKIFGDAGQHARSAVGVAELPLGVPVEIELIVEVA